MRLLVSLGYLLLILIVGPIVLLLGPPIFGGCMGFYLLFFNIMRKSSRPGLLKIVIVVLISLIGFVLGFVCGGIVTLIVSPFIIVFGPIVLLIKFIVNKRKVHK